MPRIQQAEAPSKFRIPLIPQYGGGSDPDDHLHAFNLQMDIALVSDDFRCRVFAGTLKETASQWYTQLPENHIESWDQYSQEFSRQFGSHRRIPKDPSSLISIVQRQGEGLRAYN